MTLPNPHHRSPSYLVRSLYSYCFRMAVPIKLQASIGRTELRYSLETGSLKEAKFKARLIAGRIQMLFRELEGNSGVNITGGLSNMELSPELIQEIIRSYVKFALDGGKEFRVMGFLMDQEGRDSTKQATENDLERYTTDLASGNYHAAADIAEAALEERGVEFDDSEVSHQMLAYEILSKLVDLSRVNLERLKGNFRSDIEQQLIKEVADSPSIHDLAAYQMPQVELVPEPPSEPFGKVMEEYWSETSPTWKPRTKTEYQTLRARLTKFLGDETPIKSIDYTRMREFKKHVQTTKSKGGREPSRKTVNKYLNFASGLFTFAENNHYVDKNPVKGLRIRKQRATRPDLQQDLFEGEELQKLFQSKQYLEDSFLHPHQFWLPILGLYTGARLEELCQLYVGDVKEVDGVWVLDISEDKPDKSVKTHEQRMVPLHPLLVAELDFPGFVKRLRNQRGRVFPNLKRINNRYGHAASQWFTKYRNSCGVPAKRNRKTFHSFRHTIQTRLKLEYDLPDHFISELVGHSNSNITTGRYGKRFKPKELYERTVLRLDYGLDLSHLKRSRFVTGKK